MAGLGARVDGTQLGAKIYGANAILTSAKLGYTPPKQISFLSFLFSH